MALKPVRVFLAYGAAGGPILAAGMSYQAVFAVFAALAVGFSVAGSVLAGNPALLDLAAVADPGRGARAVRAGRGDRGPAGAARVGRRAGDRDHRVRRPARDRARLARVHARLGAPHLRAAAARHVLPAAQGEGPRARAVLRPGDAAVGRRSRS
ncbi:hypothetical protein [Clavibacter zhangzhiyongii]|uniref:hypothetical protein n=1 Tax=Clavibacter zhangzhiyongii TaxID=2768071 RepID=UPI0039E1A9FA